jgi:hypothetical protein
MEQEWHLNKSVPLTLVFAIVLQTVSLVWFISQLNSAVESNTADILKINTDLEFLEKVIQDQAISMARIDENLKAIRESVDIMASMQGRGR